MTYFFTPHVVLATYRTSLGHRYDEDNEEVLMGSTLIADSYEYPFAIQNATHDNGPCGGCYDDEDIVAILTLQLDTSRYPAGWDKQASYWRSLVDGVVPTLQHALESNVCPLIFDTDSCKKIVEELIPLMALKPSVGLDVLFEIFYTAVTNNGIVRYC